jgi:6-phosphofructokinase
LRIGVLTGGGDCAGLNAAILGVAKRAWSLQDEVYGIGRGWAGLMGEGEVYPLGKDDIRGIITQSGTILRTSRTNPAKIEGGYDQALATLKRNGIGGLVAIGGDDTLGVSAKLAERGFNVVGVPKTIDNDLPSTDFCIGFDTAANVVALEIDRLQATARSHGRILVVEVMGREAGWLSIVGGTAAGADFIAIPEVPVHIDELAAQAEWCGKTQGFGVMAIAEGAEIDGMEGPSDEPGAVDAFGHVRLAHRDLAQRVADEIERRTGIETRSVVLGHVQRGGTPTIHDRYVSMLLGSAAVDYLHGGLGGNMAAYRAEEIVPVPLAEVAGKVRLVTPEIYEMVSRFFGGAPKS